MLFKAVLTNVYKMCDCIQLCVLWRFDKFFDDHLGALATMKLSDTTMKSNKEVLLECASILGR